MLLKLLWYLGIYSCESINADDEEKCHDMGYKYIEYELFNVIFSFNINTHTI